MLGGGLEVELSDLEAENSTLKGEYLWYIVEIVTGGFPTILEVHCICIFMSLGRILLEGSILKNLVDPMRIQVDLRTVQVGIQLFGIIHLWLI
jgi:hypothetical protein